MDLPASRPPTGKASQPALAPRPTLVAPTSRGGAIDRFLRLHAFELLIFVVLFILLALCLAVAPLITNDASAGSSSGSPPSGVRLVL
jgi:hypothetical protein